MNKSSLMIWLKVRHRTFKYKMLYLAKPVNLYLPSPFVKSPGIRKDRFVNDSDFDDIFDNTNKADLSATEYMMEYCRSKNYNFQLLLNDPLFTSEPTSETYTNDRKKKNHRIYIRF